MDCTGPSLAPAATIFTDDSGGLLAPDHVLHACRPITHGHGCGFVEQALLDPLKQAVADFEVREGIAMRKVFENASWTASSGHLC